MEQEYTSNNNFTGKLILDFDALAMGAMNTDAKSAISFNKKQTKLKVKGIKGKFKIKQQNGEKLTMSNSKNKSFIFEKMELSHKIQMGTKELRDFVLAQQCDLINGIKAQFTKEQFFLDKKDKRSKKRYQFINFSTRDNGYWYFKIIDGNAFFVLNTAQKEPENVFQVKAVKVNGIQLQPLLKTNSKKDFKWLKTCL